MGRSSARKLAVELLYAADVRGQEVSDVLMARAPDEPPVPEYTRGLVDGVGDRRAEIDGILARRAIGWPPDRMSAVDRNVLRVGVLELLEGRTPPAVAIDEAVELAKRLSGEEAGRFVNGVLAGVLEDMRA